MDYNFLWVPKTTYHRSAQSQFVVDVFPKVLKNFELIIEIGTFTGAFTLWLSENKSDNCKIISYDINPDYCEVNNLKDTELRIGDCFDIDVMKDIRDLINNSGRTLFLCDGGDKELEFRLLPVVIIGVLMRYAAPALFVSLCIWIHHHNSRWSDAPVV